MKKIRVEDAVGMTLCHDMTAILDNGFKGVKYKRGHVITEDDIPGLLDIGKTHIYVWDPAENEVHEDDAAIALTEAMCGENLACSGPSEGKMQVTSSIKGLFCVNSEALKQINCVPDYTVACRPNYTCVESGERLVGARIVPLTTDRENVDKAVAIAKENYPVFKVMPYKKLKAGVIITGSEIYYGLIQDRFEPVLREKLGYYGAEILDFIKCPDELDVLLKAINDLIEADADLILLTGGMSVDPDDITPTAMIESGARIVTKGVPMQPGNMLHIAYLGKTAMMGVPGASIHAKTTSLDVFLPRVFAGIEITAEEIAGYGEGGLCLGCETCHYPKCYFGRK